MVRKKICKVDLTHIHTTLNMFQNTVQLTDSEESQRSNIKLRQVWLEMTMPNFVLYDSKHSPSSQYVVKKEPL